MDPSNLSQMVYTPFADLDLLYGEAEHDHAAVEMPAVDADEPDTVDAFNAQILAGLVAP